MVRRQVMFSPGSFNHDVKFARTLSRDIVMIEHMMTKINESKPVRNLVKLLYVLVLLFGVQIVCLTALVYRTFSSTS